MKSSRGLETVSSLRNGPSASTTVRGSGLVSASSTVMPLSTSGWNSDPEPLWRSNSSDFHFTVWARVAELPRSGPSPPALGFFFLIFVVRMLQ